jgi:hypothetical protein
MNREDVASLTLAYNQEDYIEACIRALAPECGAMYVMYSLVPFDGYNPNARLQSARVDDTGQILDQLRAEFSHLHVIRGEWSYEDEMRNEGLAAARTAGFSHLLVVDADEFMIDGGWDDLRQFVSDFPDADSWWCKMRVPFKSVDWIVDREVEFLPLVVRVGDGVSFNNRRIPTGRRQRLPEHILCFNMGFVLGDSRMLEKTRTWSHAHQLPRDWYLEKWLNWTPETTNLHTRDPKLWPRVRPFGAEFLPSALQGHRCALLGRTPCES